MKGYGDPVGDSWLDIIAKKQNWNLIDRSCDGAGFITVAPADCRMNFAGIISGAQGLSPDYVIITGSANDFGTNNAQLESTTDEAIEQLRAQFPRASIIGLQVAWGDQPPPGKVAIINSQIADAMESVNGTFVDFGTPLFAHPELMQADHLHPLPAGQVALEAAIEASLARAGIVI
jgi:lysophospholipase L1-like esterase